MKNENLEAWQKKLLAKINIIDFSTEEDKIYKAFKELCSVFEDNSRVTIKNNSLQVNFEKYMLIVEYNKIKLKFGKSSLGEVIRNEKECYLELIEEPKRKVVYQFSTDEKEEINIEDFLSVSYKDIINKLMNYAVSNQEL